MGIAAMISPPCMQYVLFAHAFSMYFFAHAFSMYFSPRWEERGNKRDGHILNYCQHTPEIQSWTSCPGRCEACPCRTSCKRKCTQYVSHSRCGHTNRTSPCWKPNAVNRAVQLLMLSSAKTIMFAISKCKMKPAHCSQNPDGHPS